MWASLLGGFTHGGGMIGSDADWAGTGIFAWAGNEEPCFGLFNMKISRITPIGDGKHLRLALKKYCKY